MDLTRLIRDPKIVRENRVKLPNGSVTTKRGCKIYIPSRFAERGLAEVGIETHICGIYAMVCDDAYYAVSTINAMIRIEPSKTLKVKFKGVEYYEFVFDPGAVVYSSTSLVRIDTLTYHIYDEIFSKGRVPSYLSYDDLGGIYDTARKHAGANVGGNPEVVELMVSLIARDKTNKTLSFRSTVKTPSDLKNSTPVYIPLRSVSYAATNTTNKLGGSHFVQGLTSALVNPSERPERIETILRK